jgi:hypothetical protein
MIAGSLEHAAFRTLDAGGECDVGEKHAFRVRTPR